jgi:hypothetical protein
MAFSYLFRIIVKPWVQTPHARNPEAGKSKNVLEFWGMMASTPV